MEKKKSKTANSEVTEETTVFSSTWNKINKPPDKNPDIILVFHGSMALFQPDNSKVKFICHGREHNHKLKVSIGKCVGGNFSLTQERVIQDRQDLEFTTDNSRKEVKIFSDVDTNRSFEWIIDIEKEHGKKLTKQTKVHNNLISILDGTLYTYAITSSTFNLQNAHNWRTRSISAILGINIYLDSDNAKGFLTGYDPKDTETFEKGETHVVIFDNQCFQDGKRCEFTTDSSTPSDKNDFYLNYANIIDRTKSGVIEFVLDLVEPGSGEYNYFNDDNDCDLGVYFRSGKDASMLAEDNRAPCKATGYGSGSSSSGR